jgi:hypothetical protein
MRIHLVPEVTMAGRFEARVTSWPSRDGWDRRETLDSGFRPRTPAALSF